MERSIAGDLRIASGEALLRFRYTSGEAPGGETEPDLVVHPPQPREIIRMHAAGELYVHPTRLPLTPSVVSMMIVNVQNSFNLAKGLRGHWHTRAWVKLQENLKAVKRSRGLPPLALTAPPGPPGPPPPPPPPPPTNALFDLPGSPPPPSNALSASPGSVDPAAVVNATPGASDPSCVADVTVPDPCAEQCANQPSADSNSDNSSDTNSSEADDEKASEEKEPQCDDDEATAVVTLSWQEKYENEFAERVRVENELIDTERQYHELEEECEVLKRDNARLRQILGEAT